MSEQNRATFLTRQWIMGDGDLYLFIENLIADCGTETATRLLADVISAEIKRATVETIESGDYSRPIMGIIHDLWRLAYEELRKPEVDIVDYVDDLMDGFSAILDGASADEVWRADMRREEATVGAYLMMASDGDIQSDLMWSFSQVDLDALVEEVSEN